MGRRGPKKKQDVKRERNGRMSRSADGKKYNTERNLADLDREQRDNLSIGLEARERIWGVKPQQSRDQKAGSAIGRYCLQGLVTQAQYDAAMLFLEAHDRNLLATADAIPRSPGAVNLNATRGLPVGVENVPQIQKWRADYKAALAAIQDKQNEIRLMGNLYGALYEIVVRDHASEHLLGDLRTAANALVKHYRLDGRMAA